MLKAIFRAPFSACPILFFFRFFGILALFAIHYPLATVVYAGDTGTEFGVADDLSVMGVEGDAIDPDVEIKGFSVFGATQTSYTGIVHGPGNVAVNGYLSVSSGSYFAGSSTFPAASGIFIADGNDNEVLSKNGANGPLKWTAVSALGDNLGDHIATTTLNMNGQSIANASSGTFTQGITASSFTAVNTEGTGLFVSSSAYLAVSGGNVGIGTTGPEAKLDVAGIIRSTYAFAPGDGSGFQSGRYMYDDSADYRTAFSSNVYITGYSSAAAYFGDGSGLTGLAAAPPTGAAGGVLSGTYPNPGLSTSQTAAVTWSGAQTFGGGASFPGSGIWNSAGSVGIGEVSPGSKLAVSGGAAIGAGYDTTLAPGDGLIIEGSVGIGTAWPSAKLMINTTDVTTVPLEIDGLGPQLSGWPYKKPITISNSGSALADYPVKVTVVHVADHMNGDFSDIRFMQSDGITALYHWRESYNSFVTADFWVKIPSIPSGSSTIYVYYGNTLAASVSDEAKVFSTTNGSFDIAPAGNGWTYTGGGHNWSLTSGNVHSAPYSAYLQYILCGCTEGYIWQDISVPNTGGDLYLDFWDRVTGDSYNNTIGIMFNDTWVHAHGSGVSHGWEQQAVSVNAYKGQTVRLKIYHTEGGVYCCTGDHDANMNADDFRIRQHASPEPTPNVGAEETTSPPITKPFLYIQNNTGNVGIGKVTPATTLDVAGTVTAASFSGVGGGLTGTAASLSIGGNAATATSANTATNIAGGGAGAIPFQTGAGATTFDASNLYWDNTNKRVGIGTAGPGAALEVAGQVKITGGTPGAGKVLTSDGAGLASWGAASGDNLGNHVATTTLQMGAYGVNTSSDITAARYQINGSTMVAILPGIDSIAYGVGAGAGNITGGDYNVFIGNYAGTSNTTGKYNTATGYQALYSNTGGRFNAATGFKALYSNTGGWYNAATGLEALYLNTSGSRNTATGCYALHSNTASWDNTATGNMALYYNTTGGNNTANGSYALYKNTTGDNNTANGYQALYYNQTGSANSVVGVNAGGYGAGGANSYSSSTLMGYQAGYNLTTGSDNTFLGWQAGYNATTGTGNIVIGYDKGTSAPGASNELNIGGVLYGDLAAKTIGISTRAPAAALDIVSTGTAADQMAQIWRASDGVIVGSMSATGVMMAAKFVGDGSGLTGVSSTDDTRVLKAGDTMTGQLTLAGSTLTVTGGAFSVGGSTLVVNNGDVGIGTTGPGARLEVVGGTNPGDYLQKTYSGSTLATWVRRKLP